MPTRTTAVLMAGHLALDDEVPADPAIETASALVDEVCATVTLADGVTLRYDAVRLELIERWLACHFYCIMLPINQTASARIGVNKTIETKVDLGFNVTRYGQMAMRLDTAGGLAALDKLIKNGTYKVRPGLYHIGDAERVEA